VVIAGAGGHAVELLEVFLRIYKDESAFFYDDITQNIPQFLYDKYPVLRTPEQAKLALVADSRFAIGVGNPQNRYKLGEKLSSFGGELISVISPDAFVGGININLGIGINVMPGAVITANVQIGRGSLVHVLASVHHDATIGDFCEILPGARILGNVKIGSFTSVGSGAVILPRIKIGNNVVIGAGAVVTKDVADNMKVMGVPAKSH
jgi:sugar O-acyltransferase (sialic acid O-acetyltransferase NeuD family)